ncbi:MAG TPA: peptidoglycan-associated lipoprotein Pal [Phenylobacterium sp.]|nr:peptidoglycan-associated lipoprotein Pal [Phenylobacterium sp.]
MSFSTKHVLHLALVATAAISMTACASRPKPSTMAPTPPAPQAGPAPARPAPMAPPVSQGALPGSEQDFVVNVGDRVYFDTDEYEVRADAVPVLNGQAQWLVRYPSVQVRIEGNADERGTREYNLALGSRRANSVRDYLVAHGVAASRIATISYGKERPIDPGTDEAAWQKNRNARTAISGGAR